MMYTNPEVKFTANPEVKSFIYQQLVDFEPFITPETVVAVVAKDPLKLRSKLELEGIEIPENELKKKHRIVIVLRESGTQIQAEGLHEDIFEAIREAKTKLIGHLIEIQDSIISPQDRDMQIREAKDSSGYMH